MSTLQVSVAEIEIEGKTKKFLVFDNEAFDYELSESDLSRAIHFCGTSTEAKKSLHGEIQTHFLMCLEEFLGWPVTLEEVVTAIRTGRIELCTNFS